MGTLHQAWSLSLRTPCKLCSDVIFLQVFNGHNGSWSANRASILLSSFLQAALSSGMQVPDALVSTSSTLLQASRHQSCCSNDSRLSSCADYHGVQAVILCSLLVHPVILCSFLHTTSCCTKLRALHKSSDASVFIPAVYFLVTVEILAPCIHCILSR